MHVAVALAWVLPAGFAAYAVNGPPVTGADRLAMYRYTHDAVEALVNGVPIGWSLQAGPRYFPDLPLSLLAYMLSFGDPETWVIWLSLINLGLTYAALLLLLAAYDIGPEKRTFIGSAFMCSLLLMALHSRFFATNLLAPTFHNTLMPLILLLYALPAIACTKAATPKLLAGLAVLGGVLGLAVHANKLLLVWGLVPVLVATAGLSFLRRLSARAMLLVVATFFVAALVYLAVAELFDRLTFVHFREARLTRDLSIAAIPQRVPNLGQILKKYGWGLAVVMPPMAILLAGAVLYRVRAVAGTDVKLLWLLLISFSVTIAATLAAMLAIDLFSPRYFFYVVVATALLGVTGFALALELVGWRRFGRMTGIPAGAALVIALPAFIVEAAAIRELPGKFEEIAQALRQAQATGRIGEQGLAGYWVAHTLSTYSEFFIAPIGTNGLPGMLAVNNFNFWEWRAGCPYRRVFTFIVTAKGGPRALDAHALRARFGAPAEVTSIADSAFEVWLYPEGVANEDAFYDHLVQRLRKMQISVERLAQCEDAPSAVPDTPGP